MSALTRLIRRRSATRRRMEEIARFGADDLACLGLSRAEFRAIATMPAEKRDRMEHMAHLFGADTEAAGPWERLDIARTCANCRADAECRRVLAREDVGAADCGFCPNREAFAPA